MDVNGLDLKNLGNSNIISSTTILIRGSLVNVLSCLKIWKPDDVIEQVYKFFEKGEYQNAYIICREGLKNFPYSYDLLKYMYYILKEIGDIDKIDYVRSRINNLDLETQSNELKKHINKLVSNQL